MTDFESELSEEYFPEKGHSKKLTETMYLQLMKSALYTMSSKSALTL